MAKFKTTVSDPKRHDSLEPKRATFEAGSMIFSEGDLGLAMYVIGRGEVEIRKRNAEGSSKLLATFGKGDFFGEMCLLEDDMPRSADAVAKTIVDVVIIDAAAFGFILERNPEIAMRMMRKLARRLRDTTRKLNEYAGSDVSVYESGEAPVKEVITDAHLIDRQSGTVYPLSKEKETTIGRIDPVTGIQPDIDFTNVDSKRSISRRHAKIRREDDGSYVVLEDAGTMNGTFVNGERLITGKPMSTKGGDVLRFGAVECQFILDS